MDAHDKTAGPPQGFGTPSGGLTRSGRSGGTISATQALALAEAAGTVREAAQLLRERFAPLRVVVVDAFDMRGETPAAQGSKRTLYFGASDGHCWQVTNDPAQAVGLFVADRS